MNAFLNRRGLELAIGTVVVLAIVVLVMIVVIGFFLTGFGKSGSGIAQISEEGGKEASNIKLDFKCLGKPAMSNDDCGRCSSAYDSYQGAVENCKLCDITQTEGTRAKSGATCSVFTEGSDCNNPIKAKGCYWGYGGS